MAFRSGISPLILLLILLAPIILQAQDDSIQTKNDTFFLLKYKGLLGKLGQAMVVDTGSAPQGAIERNDRVYQRYRGRIIRNIDIQGLEFGTSISDTGRKFTNKLIRMANNLHRQTRTYVIRNNLFFQKNDSLLPYLLADNERHLRDLDFLGDARIVVRPVRGTRDSVDIIVLTKDVLSLGGGLRVSSLDRMEANVRDDNFFGWGDQLLIRGLYDSERRDQFGYGAEYTARNIAGSFINASAGFQNFAPTLNTGRKEETIFFARMVKPLVNPYMKWTYALDASVRSTANMYVTDSLYESDFKYGYFNFDAWATYNMEVHRNPEEGKEERLRTLIGIRYLQQKFQQVPIKYEDEYFFRYTDISGVLGSLSIFRQEFYKTRYIYGFGRSEDVPEGIDVSVTGGWTRKQERVRAYLGAGLEFNYFTRKESYFNYILRAGGFAKGNRMEDVDLLANLNYFSNLRKLGRWNQRTFVTTGVTTQFNEVLNEPLQLASSFGLPEFRNDSLFGGNLRATLKAESVFYSPWSVISFRFAPFVFANTSWINGNNPATIQQNIFTSLGGGLRVRNESLIFGTIELKGFFFPRKNLYNESFRFEFATNLQFKYNRQLIKRPEFVTAN